MNSTSDQENINTYTKVCEQQTWYKQLASDFSLTWVAGTTYCGDKSIRPVPHFEEVSNQVNRFRMPFRFGVILGAIALFALTYFEYGAFENHVENFTWFAPGFLLVSIAQGCLFVAAVHWANSVSKILIGQWLAVNWKTQDFKRDVEIATGWVSGHDLDRLKSAPCERATGIPTTVTVAVQRVLSRTAEDVKELEPGFIAGTVDRSSFELAKDHARMGWTALAKVGWCPMDLTLEDLYSEAKRKLAAKAAAAKATTATPAPAVLAEK